MRRRAAAAAVLVAVLAAGVAVALVRAPAAEPVQIAVLGDSIAGSTFFGADRPVRGGWPADLDANLGDRAAVRNEAAGGVTLALDGLHEDIPSVRTTFTAAVRAAPAASVAIVAAGRNDLYHATDQALQAAVDDIAAQAASIGVRVYFATILPTSTAYAARDITEGQRLRLNAFLRARYPSRLVDADRAVDPAGTGLLPPAADGGDGFHLSPDGSLRVAAAAAAALTSTRAVTAVARGAVDAVQAADARVALRGWALDESAPAAPATLRVSVDGVATPVAVTVTPRPDVDAYVHFGAGPHHGFAAEVAVAAGRHRVCTSAEGPGATLVTLANGCVDVDATPVVAPPCLRITNWERFLVAGVFRWTMTLSCRDGTTVTVEEVAGGPPLPSPVATRTVEGRPLTVSRVHLRADLARPDDMPWFEYAYDGRAYWVRVDLSGIAGLGRYATITESWSGPGHVAWVDGARLF